ncbi:hypothetical protein [Paenibacillus pini]|uniref:Uncharacterized protein n=1 Tax=Paenibacillus pini JCM 16418 TaxID=1236976 RepID=W7YHD7_9BACL|nr:hypothetical protein [Paenibacillus pini]GAF06998.1 hypothetical protein JCM16418_985 [Paenibacillus pini JCM 16418]
MARKSKKMWGLVICAGIGVLIGMQLAGSDVPSSDPSIRSSVNASQQTSPSSRTSSNTFIVQTTQEDVRNMTPEQILLPNAKKPTVDVLADKTSGLLQELSQKSIRMVVSLFSSLTD